VGAPHLICTHQVDVVKRRRILTGWIATTIGVRESDEVKARLGLRHSGGMIAIERNHPNLNPDYDPDPDHDRVPLVGYT
jgi:hypothetical protein